MNDIQTILNLIDQYVTQYPEACFSNQMLRTILTLIVNLLGSALGLATVSVSAPIMVTSTNFTDATNCPLTAFATNPVAQIFWITNQQMLVAGTDWTPLSGGGFQMLVSGFNSADANYAFIIWS